MFSLRDSLILAWIGLKLLVTGVLSFIAGVLPWVIAGVVLYFFLKWFGRRLLKRSMSREGRKRVGDLLQYFFGPEEEEPAKKGGK